MTDVGLSMTAQAQVVLLERELASISSFLEDADLALAAMDRDGRIVWTNRAQLQLAGYSREEFIGRHLREFLIGPEALRTLLTSVAEGTKVAEMPAQLLRRDRSVCDVLVSAAAGFAPDGAPLLRLVLRDVTEWKRAEREFQQTTEVLHAIVQASPAPIVAITRDGNIFLWNAAAEELFGWTAAEVMNKPLPFIPQEKLDEHRAMRQRDLTGLGMKAREICRRRKDGMPVYLLVSTAPIHAADGAIAGIMSIYVDITERKRAEEEIRKNADQLARSNAELERYAFAASHDLQEPLRLVSLYSQLLVRHSGSQLDDRGHQYLQVLQTSAERMRSLIEDLLTYSRTVATHDETLDRFPASSVVEQAVSNCQAAIDEVSARVSWDQLPAILGNRDQIAQLFQNLISNALKYRRDDVTPEVKIEAMPEDGQVHFTVSDNGAGFSMEYAERIFGLFRRLHGHRVAGTGIGLALCKRIVEQHGGRIWAESVAGRGSTFHFTLPRS